MKKIILTFLLFNLSSCMIAYNNFLTRNRQSLMQLEIGMTKTEVNSIMGTKGVNTVYQKTNNPYRSEILRGKDKNFEVWYYVTDKKKADNAITDDELTPLIFDGNKLIGWGQSFLQDTIIKYEIRIR